MEASLTPYCLLDEISCEIMMLQRKEPLFASYKAHPGIPSRAELMSYRDRTDFSGRTAVSVHRHLGSGQYDILKGGVFHPAFICHSNVVALGHDAA